MVPLRSTGVVGMILVMLAPGLCGADKPRPCERETAPLMDSATTWEVTAVAAEALPQRCFDGYFAEGISEVLTRKLGSNWEGFFDVVRARENNRRVLDLVVRSLNATVNPDDVRIVARKARGECPSEATTICKRIAVKAEGVLEGQ